MAPLPSESRFPEYGSLVGGWLVHERIGSGSHGVVFRALRADKDDGKSYALKLALQKNDARQEREVRLLSSIRHPSVPRLADSGSWTSPHGDTYPYLVMEWVEGVPLYDWAAKHGLTLRQAMGLLAQVARALEATHRHGVHRDVKGNNVQVNAEGHAVLLDFSSGWYPGANPLTDGGIAPATEEYRSPQLLFFRYALGMGAKGYYLSQPADDVYALGVTAYRLLEGDYPLRADDSEEDDDAEPVPLEAPRGLAEKCPELAALILRMLSEDPEARGSARQVAEELDRLRESSRPALGEPWGRSTSQPPTGGTCRPAPPRRCELPDWLPRLAPAAVVLVLVLLMVLLAPGGDRRGGGYAEAPQDEQSDEEKPDGGTGMGTEAMASVERTTMPPISGRVIGRDLPTRPFDGLARPPCTRWGAMEINGGCWWRPEGADVAPCKNLLYEHEGRCYIPVLTSARQPTSEDP